jgi:hypothetical protein
MTLQLRTPDPSSEGTALRCFFTPDASSKPLRVTPGAIRVYTRAEIERCLAALQAAASEAGGLGYAQAFDSDDHAEPLWFIEDAGEGAITALLPSEY